MARLHLTNLCDYYISFWKRHLLIRIFRDVKWKIRKPKRQHLISWQTNDARKMMLILCGDGGGNVEKVGGVVVVVVAEGGSGLRVFDVVMMTVYGVSE